MRYPISKQTLCKLALVIACLLPVASCSVPPANQDTFSFASSYYPAGLDVAQGYNGWGLVRFGILQTITKLADAGTATPWLASSWTSDPEALNWTFQLHPAATFADGTPVTGTAVAAAWQRTYQTNPRAREYFSLEQVSGTASQVIVSLQQPAGNLPALLADPLWAIAAGDPAGIPVGSGPYQITSFTPEELLLAANPNAWDGAAGYQKISVLKVADASVRALSLQSGELQAAEAISPTELGQFQDPSRFTISATAGWRSIFLVPAKTGPAAELNIRRAISLALDRNNYASGLLPGAFAPGIAPLSPALPYGSQELNDQLLPSSPALDTAKQLLAAAGYGPAKPLQLNLALYATRPELPLLASAIQADLSRIGINLELKTYDPAVIEQLTATGATDLVLYSMVTATAGDPQAFYQRFWPSAKTSQLARTTAVAERQELCRAIQQDLVAQLGLITIGYPKSIMVANAATHGLTGSTSDYYWITPQLVH